MCGSRDSRTVLWGMSAALRSGRPELDVLVTTTEVSVDPSLFGGADHLVHRSRCWLVGGNASKDPQRIADPVKVGLAAVCLRDSATAPGLSPWHI
jgi:hypothetical protein